MKTFLRGRYQHRNLMQFNLRQLLLWTPCVATLAWLWSEPSVLVSAKAVFSTIIVAMFAVGIALVSTRK